MRSMIDFFPETPAGFHLRVEETLMGLEEKDMKKAKVYSRRMVALIAAVLVLVFAATAVAVVQGDALRSKMSESGGDEFTAMVQDVHVSDGDGGFSFAIDEILWQGEDMYVSYTVSVPDDGNVYLFSPCDVRLDEREIEHNGIDAEFFTSMYALGGEYGGSVSQIMKLRMEPGESSGRFGCKCVFMKAEKPLKELDNDSYYALFTEADPHGNADQLMKSADVLYYTNTAEEGDPVPVVYLHQYPEVRALIEADESDKVTAEELESIGIAKKVDACEISIDVRESQGEAFFYNDVAKRTFDMEGYSIEITDLYISHFKTHFEAVIRKPGGVTGEWTADEPYGQYYSLCGADGSDFGAATGWSIGGGEMELTETGESVYCIDGYGDGIYPLETLEEIYLAPGVFDEEGIFVGRDMSRAIKLNPVYNANFAETTSEPEVDPAETDDLSE